MEDLVYNRHINKYTDIVEKSVMTLLATHVHRAKEPSFLKGGQHVKIIKHLFHSMGIRCHFKKFP